MHGVDVVLLGETDCIALMKRFITEHPRVVGRGRRRGYECVMRLPLGV